MSRPIPGSYPVYFENYISLVKADSARLASEKYGTELVQQFKNLPADKADFSYAEGKWTLKEMLQHIIDTERIFAYRALCISRKETIGLPGFDENSYAANSGAAKRSWTGLLEEFEAVRHASDLLIKSFENDQLELPGITNDSHNTVNAICFMTYGHILHHINIINERYL